MITRQLHHVMAIIKIIATYYIAMKTFHGTMKTFCQFFPKKKNKIQYL
jgi:hypothetical protein